MCKPATCCNCVLSCAVSLGLFCVSQRDGLLQSGAVSGASLPEGHYDTVAGYELRDLPGRRLRRWPRGARQDTQPPVYMLWDELEPYHWPWDD